MAERSRTPEGRSWRRCGGVAAVAVAAVALMLMGLQPVAGADTQVLADWQMNEARGATQLLDSSGNGLHGSIGDDISIGVRSSGATVHSFPYISSTAPPDPAGRLHIVSDRDALDPGTQAFAVELRFRNTHTHGNITQKGQSGASGGYWKVEVDDGVLSCVFAGTSASVALKSTIRVTDDVWRTVRCERNATEAIMYINGVREVRRAVATGSITNNWTLAIGGKSSCNSTTIQCDYFRGDLDYMRIERPSGTTPTTTSTSTTTTRPPTTTTSTTTTTRPPTTTTTTRPPTTTTTTTVKPATTLPSGRVDSVEVSGSTIVVKGRSSDPDGLPTVQVIDVVEGRRTVINRTATSTGFTVSYAASSGTHRVCVNLLDNPTGQAVPLSCQDAVVK